MSKLVNQAGLIDYLNALWKRKWLIILPTICLVIVVAIISILMPPVWEVEMILQPAKFFSQTPGGQFIDVLITDPRQIATEINQKSYNFSIAKKLKLDIQKFPKLRAEYLKDTKLVKIAINEKDVEKAKAILQSLFLILKENLDKKIFIEINNIDTEIRKNELEIDLLTKEIVILQNKLNILEQREREILAEMKAARERISRIEKEQLDALKGGGKEALGQLLYSNEIQQNFQYINTLNELISDKKIEREDL
ncbi:MAG: Wzz/FepE/Etk N-terminal domain-containing protein, partial [Candidatus Aminicenantes bacterium]|nr:Wzz/FepE/Etk N-terminal domain-containing protein [Candidatus Aminicenantes bacterium]